MTKLSRLPSPAGAIASRKRWRWLRIAFVAHTLLLLCVMAFAGCVWPLTYDAQSDAGSKDSPPVIVDSNPPMPADATGPHTIVRTAPPTPYTIDVQDNDLGDSIWVKVFVDSQPLSPIYASVEIKNDPMMPTAVRKISVPNNGWCDTLADNTLHFFDVVVSDGDFMVPTGTDARTPKENGKEATTRSWAMECQPN
jgi:hypothetical protein